MRKTSDLVNEMQKEAKGAWLVAIVVGFETEPRFVFSSQQEPLNRLNLLVQKGGAPLGLLKFSRDGDTVEGSYRPFTEYGTEEWVGRYLAGLLDHAAEIIGMSRQEPADPAPS